MIGLKNKFILRLHTAATEELLQNDRDSWTLQYHRDALGHVVITDIKNPLAAPKTEGTELPGSNGSLDLTEVYGGVFYDNKTVSVTLRTMAKWRKWFGELKDILSDYHGRVVDFAFDDSLDVKWYYTGRLTLTGDNAETGEITLEFDTAPFLQSTDLTIRYVPVATDIDRTATGSLWSVGVNPGGAGVVQNGHTIMVYGDIGDTVYLTRTFTAGKWYTMGMLDQKGCATEIGYNGNRVAAACSSIGDLRLKITIDGSHYDWYNGAYLPCAYIRYVLAALPMSGGEPADSCRAVFPNGAGLRPRVSNLGDDGILLLDGATAYVKDGTMMEQLPTALMPGWRADRSGIKTTCYLTSIGYASTDTPDIRLTYREVKLG